MNDFIKGWFWILLGIIIIASLTLYDKWLIIILLVFNLALLYIIKGINLHEKDKESKEKNER